MTDHDALDLIQRIAAAQLGSAPAPTPTPTPTPIPAPHPTGPVEANGLWRRGTFWRATFTGPGDTHSATYTVPDGAVYPPGQVQLWGDNAFANGYLDVTVDGVPTIMGDAIPVTPGLHTITAVCRDLEPTREHGAFANIQIANQ